MLYDGGTTEEPKQEEAPAENEEKKEMYRYFPLDKDTGQELDGLYEVEVGTYEWEVNVLKPERDFIRKVYFLLFVCLCITDGIISYIFFTFDHKDVMRNRMALILAVVGWAISIFFLARQAT